EATLRVEHRVAERIVNGGQRRPAGAREFARDSIGGEHRDAAPREQRRDGRFAARDAACQADAQRAAHASPEKRRYAALISSPQSIAIQPAAARYGPNGIGTSRPSR